MFSTKQSNFNESESDNPGGSHEIEFDGTNKLSKKLHANSTQLKTNLLEIKGFNAKGSNYYIPNL